MLTPLTRYAARSLQRLGWSNSSIAKALDVGQATLLDCREPIKAAPAVRLLQRARRDPEAADQLAAIVALLVPEDLRLVVGGHDPHTAADAFADLAADLAQPRATGVEQRLRRVFAQAALDLGCRHARERLQRWAAC